MVPPHHWAVAAVSVTVVTVTLKWIRSGRDVSSCSDGKPLRMDTSRRWKDKGRDERRGEDHEADGGRKRETQEEMRRDIDNDGTEKDAFLCCFGSFSGDKNKRQIQEQQVLII